MFNYHGKRMTLLPMSPSEALQDEAERQRQKATETTHKPTNAPPSHLSKQGNFSGASGANGPDIGHSEDRKQKRPAESALARQNLNRSPGVVLNYTDSPKSGSATNQTDFTDVSTSKPPHIHGATTGKKRATEKSRSLEDVEPPLLGSCPERLLLARRRDMTTAFQGHTP